MFPCWAIIPSKALPNEFRCYANGLWRRLGWDLTRTKVRGGRRVNLTPRCSALVISSDWKSCRLPNSGKPLSHSSIQFHVVSRPHSSHLTTNPSMLNPSTTLTHLMEYPDLIPIYLSLAYKPSNSNTTQKQQARRSRKLLRLPKSWILCWEYLSARFNAYLMQLREARKWGSEEVRRYSASISGKRIGDEDCNTKKGWGQLDMIWERALSFEWEDCEIGSVGDGLRSVALGVAYGCGWHQMYFPGIVNGSRRLIC